MKDKKQQNEFPRTIRYRRKGTEFCAEISGGDNPVTFLFVPVYWLFYDLFNGGFIDFQPSQYFPCAGFVHF